MKLTHRFVDVYGFAGGFSCGAAQVGMTLVGKRENRANFGTPLMEANREFLGDKWEVQASDPADWEPVHTDVVLGTPPCSAFSSMTAGNKMHGMASSINDCMRHIMNYAVKVRPQIIAMESVAQAYTKGLPLMRELGRIVNEGTGLKYHVTHVLQNNWSLGGCSKRKRYFLVLSQVPFGVERHHLDRLATLGDALSDLQDLPLTWDQQEVKSDPTWWSEGLRSPAGVDGHMSPTNAFTSRITDLTEGEKGVAWHPGEAVTEVLRRYHETHGELTESWQYKSVGGQTRADYLVTRNFDSGGFSKPRHWPWDQPARVLNGAGPYMVWHPNGRFATHRETARIMGFPDDWKIGTAKSASNLSQFWGKGTSVAPARWVTQWIKNSLDGNPGSYTGEELEHGDHLIDVSMDWKPVLARQQAELASA